MYPNDYETNIEHDFGQDVVFANVGQNFDFEQVVCQLLDKFSVNYIKFIIQEMQFYLNMCTYKTTKKHLFTKQNRGEQKMQGIIDISYRQISTFTLQIIVPLSKLSSQNRNIVLQWLYDECDKLCAQFHSNPLNRADLFFEQLIKNCEEELAEREATQSHSKRMKKLNLTKAQQWNQQQMGSNNFAVPPPPYTSPNNPIGKFSQSSYQSYRQQQHQQLPTSTFVRPNGVPQYSDIQTVAQATPFNARSQQMNTVTNAQYMHRPMTAPIRTTATVNSYSPYTVANSNATRNQCPTQSTNHFQQLNPSQNVAPSQSRTMLASPQQPMHVPLSQQGNASNQIYDILNSNNSKQSNNGIVAYGTNGNLSFQPVLFAPALNDQQVMLNATGFEALPIQRQRIEDSSAASNDARNSRKQDASTYLHNTSAANPLSQNNQPQQQISMTYDECIADGTRTPTVSIRLQMGDLLNFNATDATNNGNALMQAMPNQRSNELFTPNKRTNYYQSERIDGIVNDELRLSDSVEPLEFEYEITSDDTGMVETYTGPTGNEVTIENSNSERVDAEVSRTIVDGATEPLPSMPELLVDPNTETLPPPEPNPPTSTPERLDELNPSILVAESPPPISKSTVETPTETTGNPNATTFPPKPMAHNSWSDAPCTSSSILNPSNAPPVTTNEHTIFESAQSCDTQANDDNDCEMVLVATHTQFRPFVKKEEPTVANDDPESASYNSFNDVPSARRKCKRYIDLTEEEDDCDSDVVVLESDEEGVIEEKFVSIPTSENIFAPVHCPMPITVG